MRVLKQVLTINTNEKYVHVVSAELKSEQLTIFEECSKFSDHIYNIIEIYFSLLNFRFMFRQIRKFTVMQYLQFRDGTWKIAMPHFAYIHTGKLSILFIEYNIKLCFFILSIILYEKVQSKLDIFSTWTREPQIQNDANSISRYIPHDIFFVIRESIQKFLHYGTLNKSDESYK